MGQTQISTTNQKSRKTQLIFLCFLLLFSFLFLFFLPLTLMPRFSTTPIVTFQTTNLFGPGGLLDPQKITSQATLSFNGSVLVSVVAQEKIEFGSYGYNGSDPLSVTGNGSGLGLIKMGSSCDIFDGRWVLDNGFDPFYPPGSCPFLDYTFNCFNNGRSDVGYLKYKWQPYECDIPRFNGKIMLEILRGKRMVFVGDSLNRNMWESLICALRMSVSDKASVFEISGKRQFKTEGFYAFRFEDYNCTIEFIRSPFLVQEWKWPKLHGFPPGRETLRLDMMQSTTSNYHDADFLIFNTGHWWTHYKTKNGESFFQEGNVVHRKLRVVEAFTKALQTWANWVDTNINKHKTKVFFVGYSSSHFRGGQWNSGGNCEGEREPITDDALLGRNPWMVKKVEAVMSKMKTPVVYLNITRMTGYRKDGHPSIYRLPEGERRSDQMPQDCSHWCLPGVPDSWNHLLYASLLPSFNVSTYH